MKQKTYIAALLAGMLALAGCGGSSGISPEEAASQAAEAAEEAAAKIVTDASAAIAGATTIAAVEKILQDLDRDEISQKDFQTLEGEATARKNSISATAVGVAENEIEAAATVQEVTDALETAKANGNILMTAHADLTDKANRKTGEIQKQARQSTQRTNLENLDTALTGALTGAKDAGDDVDDALIMAVETARANLDTAISQAADVDDKSSYETSRDNANADIEKLKTRQGLVKALMDAKSDLDTSRSAAGNTPTREQYNAVITAHGALKTALDNANNAGDTITGNPIDTSTYQTAYDTETGWATAQNERLTREETQRHNQQQADALAMTLKLWEGLRGTPLANNASSTPRINASTGVLSVQRGDSGVSTATPLKEDKDTMVTDLHGWTGSEHTAKADGNGQGGGTYTARLYSNVGTPEPGLAFSTLTGFDFANGELPSASFMPAEVSSPRFDQGSGDKTFKLPSNNGNPQDIEIPGTYSGVSGHYICDTGSGRDQTCTVRTASEGFTFVGTWSFRPTNPDTLLMQTPDNVYESYGWWIHEADDGKATVSAFTVLRGAVPRASDLQSLNGTATYQGGAAGKYAIRTGSTNDAGHFIADATLNANFSTDKVSGTVSNFKVGDDGQSRDWSIALEEAILGNDGSAGPAKMTTWTMGGTAAEKSGAWEGQFYNVIKPGEDGAGTPQSATGKFHSEYLNRGQVTGRMVGAFGVNLDN